jgi:hypothetical protein
MQTQNAEKQIILFDFCCAIKKQYINLVELHEEIEKLFEEGEKLDKRKKKAYQAWKEKINFLIDMYNARATFKTYNKVK